MKNSILIFVCFALMILTIRADVPIPCVWCTYEHYDPVCAVPTIYNDDRGSPKTFQNSCVVTAQDCGFTKPQFEILYKGRCK
ncbi:hypothetical protein Bhyg_15034 [Pseudolycoriella hygida]|uniref:Kazal-like domain-containing protein n=1 Tax=Pseudolycoriella hygida TaxID=35572 RepID=A0A9Q0MRS3_9DIPT|nr:hypothetical protein Bhyg_15034 [Pseudolycoriella hygida]